MDLVRDYARPRPLWVIATVLGIPDDRRGWLAEPMGRLHVGFARQHDAESVRSASGASSDMLDFFTELRHQRAASPRDDLMSILVADLPDDREGRADLLANCLFFIEAGHNTTSSLITGAVALFLAHPDQLARVRLDSDLMPSAIEEALRMVSPLSVVVCRARETVDAYGYHVAAGEQRLIFPAGANRDADRFDEPNTFDVTRMPNPHVAFSAGAHFCLGAPLARLRGEIAIRTLFDRLPNLRAAGDPEWLGSIPLRMPQSFPVAW
jgi:cytochrome P450